ncbi:MAG: hypothetical protein JRJ00_00225 [Deltaproteobacteria bacterium]|nr:hypothetical protein [Deltaproteobacteria bacterium]
MSKTTEVLLSMQKENLVTDILTQATSFPYTPTVNTRGVAISNDGEDTVTAVINDGIKEHTINCSILNRNYTGSFERVISINITAGTTYQIELRRV